MNNRKLLSILGATAVAGSILAGGIITVSAQEPTSTPGATSTAPAPEGSDMGGMTRMAHHGGKHDGKGMKGAVAPEELAAFLGVDVETLKTAREEGKTLATVAEEAGKTRDQLKTFLVDQAEAKLAEAVSSGKLTQEQADEKAANLDAKVDEMLDRVGGPEGNRGGGFIKAAASKIAEFLGIEVEALKTARQEGKTLATVADEAGKTRDQLKTFLVSEAEAKLAEAVASGKLTQEQADEKAAGLDAKVDRMIDNVRPAGHDHGPKGSMQQAPAQQ